MNYTGIDLSTHAIDVVNIDADTGAATWTRFTMWGKDAWDRTREVKGTLAEGGFSRLLEDTIAVAIEEPAGKNPGRVFRIQGSVLSQIPVQTLCFPLMPSQWRKLCGMPGNAPKDYVAHWVERHGGSQLGVWEDVVPGMSVFKMPPQDACDAYCLALACSKLVQQGEMVA